MWHQLTRLSRNLSGVQIHQPAAAPASAALKREWAMTSIVPMVRTATCQRTPPNRTAQGSRQGAPSATFRVTTGRRGGEHRRTSMDERCSATSSEALSRKCPDHLGVKGS